MTDLTREKYRLYIKVTDTNDGVEKYFVVGSKATSGVLAFGTTTETKTSITQATSYNTAKKGAWSMPVATELDLSDMVVKDLLASTVNLNVTKLYDVLVVWEFITENAVPDNVLAHTFKAIIPLTDLGGDGQATLATNFTISSSTDVMRGFVDISSAGLKYDALNDIYSSNAFTINDDKLLSIEYKEVTPPQSSSSRAKSTQNSEA